MNSRCWCQGRLSAQVSSSAFDENFAVFGDGLDYDWAMDGEDEDYDEGEEAAKKDLRLEDVSRLST